LADVKEVTLSLVALAIETVATVNDGDRSDDVIDVADGVGAVFKAAGLDEDDVDDGVDVAIGLVALVTKMVALGKRRKRRLERVRVRVGPRWELQPDRSLRPVVPK